jgi:SAM-dependent methyltransferase
MGTATIQGTLWGAAAQDWAELQEPSGAPLYEATFDAMGLTAGTRLLDLGCGAGLALQLAAKRGVKVAGFDASEALLAVARSRLVDTDLRQGDLEDLPYDPDSFGAVTAFNSVQYASVPVRALQEVRRVAEQGAPVAVASWGDPERCKTRTLLASLGSLMPPPPPGGGGPFALAAPGALEALVESAMLTAERAIEVGLRSNTPTSIQLSGPAFRRARRRSPCAIPAVKPSCWQRATRCVPSVGRTELCWFAT